MELSNAGDDSEMSRFFLLIGAISAVSLGIGAFTFSYGEGLSYFSKDPEACQNCHIMRGQFDSWQKASHHTVATCVDCHLPHDFVGKYLAKAENGYNHSRAFTLQDFPEPITITPKNSKILQENCIECHFDMAANVQDQTRSSRDGLECVHCHMDVGHGDAIGLGGPLLNEEY